MCMTDVEKIMRVTQIFTHVNCGNRERKNSTDIICKVVKRLSNS